VSLRAEHGGLYVADLNPRRGTEAGKIRPVLVIQTDLLNTADHPSTWVLPCTSKLVGESLLRVPLPKGIAGNATDCEIMIDQGRAIDTRRLRRKLGTLPRPVLAEVKEKLRRLGEL
jgi:mRNA interferase MazF